MKFCIALIVLVVLATGPFAGPESVSAHVAIIALKLDQAIRAGDVAGVEREANAENVNAINDIGENSLLVAIGYNNLQVIQKLIEKGANVNHADMAGTTPLKSAKGKPELEALLRANGAN